MPNQSKVTIVKGIRATKEFWQKCDIVAKEEKETRNDLVVKAVTKYCEKVLTK